MADKHFMCVVLFYFSLHHQNCDELESSCVNMSPSFMQKETMLVTGKIGRPLSVLYDINEICMESTLKTWFLLGNDQCYPLHPTGNKRYTYMNDIVPANTSSGYIGCTIMSFLGEKVFGYRLHIVNRPIQIPILSFPEPLFLNESELVECKLREIAIPRPRVQFYINDEKVSSLALPCNKIGGCTTLSHINGLKRQWHGGKVKCCTSGPFGNICSASKTLTLQFPPLSVNITHKVLLKSTSNAIVNFTCDIVAARPACNVSWNHEGNVTDKGQMVAQERENGIQTVAFIVLSLSIKSQVVSCNSLCPLFNETAVERLHVHLYHISKSTSDYDGYSSNDECIADWLISIIFFSVFGNALLGFYFFLTENESALTHVENIGSSYSEVNTLETNIFVIDDEKGLFE